MRSYFNYKLLKVKGHVRVKRLGWVEIKVARIMFSYICLFLSSYWYPLGKGGGGCKSNEHMKGEIQLIDMLMD
jgi:hypothetical protein